MGSRLSENISSQYFEAANVMRGKQSRRRIVAYVESYDDIYFWRTVLSSFENEQRYFEVMLPSKNTLTRGKKSVLMNFMGDNVGPDMIACVDADYDYVLQGFTPQSKRVLESPYVFHTYVYAIENFQCYAPALHDVCVAVTLNDHRIFDFRSFFQQYSEACFPLFVWSVWAYRTGNHNKFTLSEYNRVTDPSGFKVQEPQESLDNVRRKVQTKVRELQRQFPNNKEAYLNLKDELIKLGITPQTTYLYMQGHHLFDTIVAPILDKVCTMLRQERQAEITQSKARLIQKQNELSCYENSQQDVKAMLKKHMGYMVADQFLQIRADLKAYLENPGVNAPTAKAAGTTDNA